jgi:phage tail-like protein
VSETGLPKQLNPAAAPGASATVGEPSTKAGERSGLLDAVLETAATLVEALNAPTPVALPAPSAPAPDAKNAHGSAVVVAHAADFLRRYPGEDVTFFTQITAVRRIDGFLLRVELPTGVELVEALDLNGSSVAEVEVAYDRSQTAGSYVDLETRTLSWQVNRELAAGAQRRFAVRVTVPPVETLHLAHSPVWSGADYWLISHAAAAPLIGDEQGRLSNGWNEKPVRESVAVAVYPKSRYLQYLPALYERDTFMGRFLMLFESFWAPIDMQIADMAYNFDPGVAPISMVRWLADRFNLGLDDDLAEENQRALLRSAVHLFRKRGTRQGLQELLEAYTDGQVKISEHRADNFRIGKGGRLGQGVALGAHNQPHTFTVRLTLPPLKQPAGPAEPLPAELERQERRRRERIRTIIDAETPAHVTYTIEFNG